MRRGALVLVAVVIVAMLGGCTREARPTRTPSSPATAGPGQPGVEEAPLPAATSATGMPDVGAMFEPTPPPQVYVVVSGDTLSAIAARFGTSLDALVAANGLSDPNALQVGQTLNIPSTEADTSVGIQLLPNSEFVNSPAYVDFDVRAFASQQGGYLAEYYENVGGEVLSGPEIVERAVHHYSVGPRTLLAILELKSGWVTNPNPTGYALSQPMGYTGGGWDLFSRQLAWAADRLNRGYYDWRGRGVTFITWADGSVTRISPTLNAATAGLQYFFAQNASKSQWEEWVGEGPNSFADTYRALFGDPDTYAIEPLIPANTPNPTLSLPWSEGEMWYYTGGPHGGWGDGSGWAALDFVPDEGYLGCQPAAAWSTAAAPGLVIYSREGEVMLDLDEDGHEETGWVLFYLHVGSQGRVEKGTHVEQGDPIGHPSCEGGFTESTHVHFARKYNGEWIAADGPLPMVLSGWTMHSAGEPYEGSATRGGETRTACECRDEGFNGLRAD